MGTDEDGAVTDAIGNMVAVQSALDAGGSPNARAADGRSALEVAIESDKVASIWAPTAVTPQPDVVWSAVGAGEIGVACEVDGHPVAATSHRSRWGSALLIGPPVG